MTHSTNKSHSTQDSTHRSSSPQPKPQTKHEHTPSNNSESESCPPSTCRVIDISTSEEMASTESQCVHKNRAITDRNISYVGYGVFVGDYYAVCRKFLEANQIGNVLSIGKIPPEKLPRTAFKHGYIEIDDDWKSGPRIKDFLDTVVQYIEEETKDGGTVFVHCEGGESRSVTAVTEYLHVKKNFKRKQALLWVASKRPRARPHPVFMKYMAGRASQEGQDFSFPWQEKDKPYSWDKEEVYEFLKKANHEELFAGCETDRRKNLKLTFRTEEGKLDITGREYG